MMSNDHRELIRETLILRIGDREDGESREQMFTRNVGLQAALAWLDAPGRILKLNNTDYQNVLEALDYAADDYTDRADFEDKHTDPDARDDEREEQLAYEDAANRYGDLAARIRATVKEVHA